ncbi:class I adenylate cyclase [Parashewanella spongiae]|uniref:Adenylate cyclase n=1 Tax=Parashewanella spongiae TaxID=342950 RepID=A0A3A6U568_9GAMM|nr:class I adenylate cyclase [Parashewanella spongiae]MCL1079472.1 class I adenylate cyclase [Parashewanella spongiae]RJY11340.1 class I adenylate cyclase [Parashewanella spongiae]
MLEQKRFSHFAEKLNKVRLTRALSLLPTMQQHLFNLIPVLLEYHDIDLPGFTNEHTPRGIYGFNLTTEHKQDCEIFNFKLPNEASPDQYIFEGIYAMGSVASFGQSCYSDIDIWAIHRADATPKQLSLLKNKLSKLSKWFEHYQLEVNFYLVHPQQFSDDNYSAASQDQSIGKEHSGSAQHWLLLEEFYRSQIRLAGRGIAWWPHLKELPELLHLGDVRELSAGEYFGASLWHLYKGIEKPHKALLKVLLLEAYSANYPNPILLTDKIWQRTQEGNFSLENDPYYVLYEYIEDYLVNQDDAKRLEVLRRCFYLKCGVKLTQLPEHNDWRVKKMQQLVSNWNWSDSLISTLDNCEQWRSGQLKWFNDQLKELMLSSYQTLLAFASKQQLNDSLRMGELNLLTRKLHTFFHHDEHQIGKLNPLWSEHLAEEELTIIHSNRDGQYYLYRQALSPKALLGQSPIYKTHSLAGILMWACFNGAVDNKTKWHQLEDRKLTHCKIDKHCKQLLNTISGSPCRNKVSKYDLSQPWHYRQLLIMVNLSNDPTCQWQGQEMMIDVLNVNIFSLGRRQQNMLGSIDIMATTSWGEWQCHSFNGKLAILDALTFIASGLKRAPSDMSIKVMSCSQRLQNQLQQQVEKLVRQTLRLTHQVQESSTLLQPVHIAQRRYGIFINNNGLACQDLHDAKSFYQRISCDQLTQLPRPELCNDPLTCAPPVILNYSTQGSIQYFLRQQRQDVEVFVLDDNNEISHYVQHEQDMDQLVSTISQHYAFDELTSNKGHFNLPQFFKLERIKGQLQVLPFGISADDQLTDF